MSSDEPPVELALEVTGTFWGSLSLLDAVVAGVVVVGVAAESGSALLLMAFLKSSVAHIDSSKCSAQCFETLEPAWPSNTAKKLQSFKPIDPRLGSALLSTGWESEQTGEGKERVEGTGRRGCRIWLFTEAL